MDPNRFETQSRAGHVFTTAARKRQEAQDTPWPSGDKKPKTGGESKGAARSCSVHGREYFLEKRDVTSDS